MENVLFLVRADGSLELEDELDRIEQRRLQAAGFISVPTEDGLAVFTSHPRRWDDNNGVTAVWLSQNECWLAPSECVSRDMPKIAQSFNLKKGAYVPFSNDGGHFLRHYFLTEA
jgi:hypothetical protein